MGLCVGAVQWASWPGREGMRGAGDQLYYGVTGVGADGPRGDEMGFLMGATGQGLGGLLLPSIP